MSKTIVSGMSGSTLKVRVPKGQKSAPKLLPNRFVSK
jgi:hypothetical protein